MIFIAQLPYFVDESWQMYAMVAGALAIIYILPRFTKVVPSSLVAIIVITIIAVMTGGIVTDRRRYGGVNPSFTILSHSRYSI